MNERIGKASGTQANLTAYFSVLQPGDTIMGLNLAHGGHLSHGHPLNLSGKFFKVVPFNVKRETETRVLLVYPNGLPTPH